MFKYAVHACRHALACACIWILFSIIFNRQPDLLCIWLFIYWMRVCEWVIACLLNSNSFNKRCISKACVAPLRRSLVNTSVIMLFFMRKCGGVRGKDLLYCVKKISYRINSKLSCRFFDIAHICVRCYFVQKKKKQCVENWCEHDFQ